MKEIHSKKEEQKYSKRIQDFDMEIALNALLYLI